MPLLDKPSACTGCPAEHLGKSFVRSIGPRDAMIAMLGQGPGQTEAYQGQPFVGQSGHRLNLWLHRAKLQRYKIHIDNVVKCWLPNNRPPTTKEVAFCRAAHWQEELDNLPWRVLVPIGVPAMKAFLGNRAGANTAGHVIPLEDGNDKESARTQREPRAGNDSGGGLSATPATDERFHADAGWTADPPLRRGSGTNGAGEDEPVEDVERGPSHQRYIVPLLHPAFIQRGQFAQEPAQILYLKRIKQISLTGKWPALRAGEAPPGAILYPTLEEMYEWSSDIDTQGITVDIENAGDHITIVGLCRIKDLVSIVIRFRRKGGELFWTSVSQLRAVITWLSAILFNAAIPKVFHNGQAHDIPILEKTGFITRNYSFDTMLGQHIAYPELPKRLEFVASLYTGVSGWKRMVGEDEGEGK